MDWQKHIDIYCERVDESFWSEPLNAISNLAFLLAAFLAYRLWQKSKKTNENLALILVTAIVGVGSFIFHTIATTPAMLADIIPIIIFIHFGFTLVLRRILGFSWELSIGLITMFFVVNVGIKLSPISHFLNGSVQYLPALAALFAVSGICYLKKSSQTKLFASAGVVFALSLACRSIDMQICAAFPLGSHFMWHILNPIVMYLVMRGLIKNSRKA